MPCHTTYFLRLSPDRLLSRLRLAVRLFAVVNMFMRWYDDLLVGLVADGGLTGEVVVTVVSLLMQVPECTASPSVTGPPPPLHTDGAQPMVLTKMSRVSRRKVF